HQRKYRKSPQILDEPSFHQADNVRGTRHHGLVERPARNRFHPLHRRSGEKPGRQISFFTV
ncbi:hypothetical protein STEG23_007104, partial [Scotinomys teguina]